MFIVNVIAGLVLGYVIGSVIESWLHEHVSDAPARYLVVWRRYPRVLQSVFLNARFGHHVIHHHQTYRKNHITQFESLEERARLADIVLRRGRYGRTIVAGDFGNHLRAEGALLYALPLVSAGVLFSLFLPLTVALPAFLTLVLPPLFSYAIHPVLHVPFAEAQRSAPPLMACLLRTRYMRALYRNHFLHHHYGGTSNYNLVLGGDVLRRRVRAADAGALQAMKDTGMPLD